MARPQKEGLTYFPLDVDLFDDDKLFDIQNEFGCLGEVIYLRLLCLVYKNGYYYKFDSIDKLSAMMIKSIGNRWVGNKQTVIQVIRALVEVDLFSKTLFSSNVMTSESIQRRYLKATERRQLMNKKEYWLLENSDSVINDVNNSDNVYNNGVNVYNNSVNVCNKYTKEKESKEKENKHTSVGGGSKVLIEYATQLADERKDVKNKQNYIKGIIRKWEKVGVTTIEEAKSYIPMETVSRKESQPKQTFSNESIINAYNDISFKEDEF